MKKRLTPLTDEETAIIRKMYAECTRDQDIVDTLNALPSNIGQTRRIWQVYSWRLGHGLSETAARRRAAMRQVQERAPTAMDSATISRERALHGDRAFKKAMLAAIKRGREDAQVGVFKDRRPLKSARFETATFSYGASSAASCAEA